MSNRILFLDLETFYSREYSLSKMAPPNYILDQRFELINCAVAFGNEPSYIVDGPDFGAFIKGVDPSVTTTVTFNSLFDNCILAWRYGWVPKRMLCSMSMARMIYGAMLPSVALKKVAEFLDLPAKKEAIHQVIGMHRAEIIQAGLWPSFCDYANHDNELNRAVFKMAGKHMMPSELRIMGLVLRCGVCPQFIVDVTLLQQHLNDLATQQSKMLNELNVDASQLSSTRKFAQLLTDEGVEIELKQSVSSPSKMIPAFAKTDQFMTDLLGDDNPRVAALAAARLGTRSTIEVTRGERMLSIAGLNWQPPFLPHSMPIPLRISGAHTHRLSGDWSLNMQNLPSGRTAPSKLRKSLIAPPGHKVVVYDQSQVEARITAWLAGQKDLLEQFAKNLDPYSILASRVFGYPVDKKVHLIERFIGKSGVLGLGFGCGTDKFYLMVLRAARLMKMDIAALKKVWTRNLAEHTKIVYRETNKNIIRTWGVLDDLLQSSWIGRSPPQKFGPCIIGTGYVEGPGGLRMVYAKPRRDLENELAYDYAGRTHKMYGAKFFENIVQFVSRIILMNAALRLETRGYKFALQEHDKLAYIVPDADVDNACKIIYEEMTRSPTWANDLPLDAEGGAGLSFGDAK